MPKLKNRKGVEKTNRKDINEIATLFYEELYSLKQTNQITRNQKEKRNVSVDPFTVEEIQKSIHKLKKDKSPGPDNIKNESIDMMKPVIAVPLTKIFNKILEEKEQIPMQWTEAHISLLYKKGDPHDISNYRPISLMSNIYKKFSTTLLQRLTPILDNKQPTEQAGFMKGFSTTDHLQTLSQIIEKHTEFQIPLYIGFVDFKKAFDSITHTSIWQALENQDIPEVYIQVIKKDL